MAGGKRVRAVIAIGMELIVGGAAETGVAGIRGSGLLVQQGVTEVEGEARGAAVHFGLERVRAAVAEVAEADQITSQSGIGQAGEIGRGISAVSIIRIAQ